MNKKGLEGAHRVGYHADSSNKGINPPHTIIKDMRNEEAPRFHVWHQLPQNHIIFPLFALRDVFRGLLPVFPQSIS
jgi:hypothetical protein